MHDWKKTILQPTDTLDKAIHVLTKEALKIVMVSDECGQLIGTVTDGDVRRALIRHCDMDTRLVDVMRKDPTTVAEKEDDAKILDLMKRKSFSQIPIIDSNNKIVGLKTIHNLIEGKKYDNPIFLMPGGLGSRLRPLTNDTPKPLLKVGTKPIMEIILEQFIESGFHQFFVSTYYKSEMLKDFFGNGSRWGASIEYIDEETPLGTGGALGLLPPIVSKLPIIMMNCDLLTRLNFKHLLNYHKEHGGIATMCTRKYDFQVPYGVIETDGLHATSITEKPVYKSFVNAGIYVLEPSLIDAVEKGCYLDMPDLINTQLQNNQQVNTFPIHEYWLDIGRMEEFERANHEFFTSFMN